MAGLPPVGCLFLRFTMYKTLNLQLNICSFCSHLYLWRFPSSHTSLIVCQEPLLTATSKIYPNWISVVSVLHGSWRCHVSPELLQQLISLLLPSLFPKTCSQQFQNFAFKILTQIHYSKTLLSLKCLIRSCMMGPFYLYLSVFCLLQTCQSLTILKPHNLLEILKLSVCYCLMDFSLLSFYLEWSFSTYLHTQYVHLLWVFSQMSCSYEACLDHHI